MTRVLILAGGPDAEREISIASAETVHQGCLDAGFDATLKVIDRPTLDEIKSWETDVVFPVLHGRFGEGGALQALLEQTDHPFVGCQAQAARLAMDKMGTKLIAARFSIPTPAAVIFDPADAAHPDESFCPLELPVILKPVADGSSVGIHICHDQAQWLAAVEAVADELAENPNRVYMIERMVVGRELTVSLLANAAGELETLPIIEISPAEGVYDFEAKYTRDDTIYTLNPDLSDTITTGIREHAGLIAVALGVRHLARVDFLCADDEHWALLEVNTMPGFTKTSLMPKAAQAHGIDMPQLCTVLIENALQDFERSRSQVPHTH
jgi:D-alanine-D-alanine ligase